MMQRYYSYLYQNTVKNSREYFMSLLEKNPKAKLLDCGCWDGSNTLKYGSYIGTNNLYGVEIWKPKVKEAKAKGVIVKYGDLDKKLPFKNEAFNVVVAYHVIEHLVNVQRFVSEIHRILKKGGYAIIGTPNLASWHNIFALLIGIQPFSGPTIYPNYDSEVLMVKQLNARRNKDVFSDYYKEIVLQHIKVMTTRALVRLFRGNHFKIENLKGFGYYPMFPLMSKALSYMDPYHSHYIILKARKGL